jgi:hypothetical protein
MMQGLENRTPYLWLKWVTTLMAIAYSLLFFAKLISNRATFRAAGLDGDIAEGQEQSGCSSGTVRRHHRVLCILVAANAGNQIEHCETSHSADQSPRQCLNWIYGVGSGSVRGRNHHAGSGYPVVAEW